MGIAVIGERRRFVRTYEGRQGRWGCRTALAGQRRRRGWGASAGLQKELAQAVHALLHDREEEEETIRQLSIDAALDLGSFAHECEVAMAWTDEHEVVTSLPTVAMSEIISWRKSWNPWKYRNHMAR